MSLDLASYPDLLVALLPELVLTVGGLALVLLVAARHRSADDLRAAGGLAFATLVLGLAATWWLWWRRATPVGAPAMIALDDYRLAATALFLGTAALTVLLSQGYLEREGLLAPEFYPLLVFATLGMMLMAAGDDLMVIFLGLELMSICVYVLTGIDRGSAKAAEAAFKYFLIGAFASAFLLYGIALTYGASATTNLTLLGTQVRILGLGHSPMLLLGLGLLLIGFGFKVAAVPFHMWAPDVYDGAPTPVTAFMAAGVKAAAFVALVRILVEGFAGVATWHGILWWLAVLTMLGGNLIALAQRTVKRMLAYSSVAHAGYLLAAVATGTPLGSAAVLFYLLAYVLATLAVFALLAAKGRHGEQDVRIDDLAGLSTRHPALALALAICMLSLLGFPGTAGFMGKWYILVAATGAGQWALAAVLAIATAISAGYYLPVIMAMYMKPEPSPDTHAGMRLGTVPAAVVVAAIVGVLVLGVVPGGALDVARTSGSSLGAPQTPILPSVGR
ncbi:MAG TPA: NADH-quinone oxidoreductase subunit N [Gemmatimonadales bacterium]|nr:NADH-quinone oxidoreductase subunit N [Gemmatimonadales bacterium]